MQGVKAKAAKAAFPYTIPILAGFLFLGIAYGVYMNSLGFLFVYPLCMRICILQDQWNLWRRRCCWENLIRCMLFLWRL